MAAILSASVWAVLMAAAASFLKPRRSWYLAFGLLAVLIVGNLTYQYLAGAPHTVLEGVLFLKIVALQFLTLVLLLRHAFLQRQANPLDRVCGAVAG